MALLMMLRAIVPRLLFTVHALTCVWRIAMHTHNSLYWLLLLLILPLPLELIVALVQRKGKDYKWVSLAIVLYLINLVPAVWLIEVRYFEMTLNDTCPNTTINPVLPPKHLLVRRDVPENPASGESGSWSSGTDTEEFLFPSTKAPTSRPFTRDTVMTSAPAHSTTGYLSSQKFTLFETELTYVTTPWPKLREMESLKKRSRMKVDVPKTTATVSTHFSTEDHGPGKKNSTRGKSIDGGYIIAQVMELETTVNKLLPSSDAWTLYIHQMLLLLLIIGRWLLPTGAEVSREKLSQLLLEFIGTAGDTLEFKMDTMQDSAARCNTTIFYCVMAVWTWSLIQFPLVIKVHKDNPATQGEVPHRGLRSLMRIYRNDLWTVVISVFIQDGPFLVVRLMLLIRFGIQPEKQMLLFFTIKNILVLMLQVYRLAVIYGEYQALLRVPCRAAPPCQHEMKSPNAAGTGGKTAKTDSSDEGHRDSDTIGTNDSSYAMTVSVSHSEKTRQSL